MRSKKKVYEVTDADSNGRAHMTAPTLTREVVCLEFFSFNAVVDYAKEHGLEAVLVTYAPPDPLYFEF